MKTVLYNLLCSQPSYGSKYHGGGEYVKTIFKKLVIDYSNRIRIIAFYDKNRFIDEWIKELIEKYAIKVYHISKLDEITQIFEKETVDVFYSGSLTDENKIVYPEKMRKITTIHGLRDMEMVGDWKAISHVPFKTKIKLVGKLVLKKKVILKHKRKFTQIINTFDDIICVSDHTKFALKLYFPFAKNVHRFYTPFKQEFEVDEGIDREIREKYAKYILVIGGNRWLKNPYRAIEACLNLQKEKRIDYNVVVVGELDRRTRKRNAQNGMFYNIDYVAPDMLEALYKNCEFFLYPSLNEGFGMPPLEAMKYGKTCIVSAVCSLPEVYQNSVYYVNPYDVKEIENRILMAAEQPMSALNIQKRYNEIRHMQDEAIDGVCQLIAQ